MEDQDFFIVCGSILALWICLGLVGNIISLITWRVGRRCRNLPGATFFTALSFSDTITLATAGLNYDIQLLFGINLWDLNIVSCALLHTTWHLFFIVSTWIIVFLSIQRAMAVTQSLKSTRRTRRKKELVAVSILFVVSLMINLPFAFGAKMMPENWNKVADTNGNVSVCILESSFPSNASGYIFNGSVENKGYGVNAAEYYDNFSAARVKNTCNMVCGANPKSFYYKYEKEFHNWFIDFGLVFSAPLCILTVCNIIILVTVCRHKRNPALKDSRSNGRGSSALTARVVMLSVVQCVSVGPYSIASLIPGALPENNAVDMVFFDRLFTITVMIWYLNNCVNFILYNVFGQAFRRDCMDLFRRICRCPQQNRLIVSSRQFKHGSIRTSSL